jgi:hypothetical protein
MAAFSSNRVVMSRRNQIHERSRAWMLLLALVPGLLVASVLAGNVLLVHRHDEHGSHVHVVESRTGHAHSVAHPAEEPEPIVADEEAEALLGPLSAEHGEGAPLRLSFQGNWSFTSLGAWTRTCPALPVAGSVEPRVVLGTCAPPHAGTGPPGRARGKQRSGLVAVVTTSRAIRI